MDNFIISLRSKVAYLDYYSNQPSDTPTLNSKTVLKCGGGDFKFYNLFCMNFF